MKRYIGIYSIFTLLFSLNCFAATMRIHNATDNNLQVTVIQGYYPGYTQVPTLSSKSHTIKPKNQKYIDTGLADHIFGVAWIANNGKCYEIAYKADPWSVEGKVEMGGDGKYKSKKEDIDKKWDDKPWKQAKESKHCKK